MATAAHARGSSGACAWSRQLNFAWQRKGAHVRGRAFEASAGWLSQPGRLTQTHGLKKKPGPGLLTPDPKLSPLGVDHAG